MDETEVRAALADSDDTNRFRSPDWAGPPPGEWVDPRLPDAGTRVHDTGQVGAALTCLVLAVGLLALGVLLPALWLVQPWLLLMAVVAVAAGVLLDRLRVAGARMRQIIAEETTRDGGTDG